MAGRKNPNELAIDAVLDEFRSIKKRGRKTRKPIFSSRDKGNNPINQWYSENRINPNLFRT